MEIRPQNMPKPDTTAGFDVIDAIADKYGIELNREKEMLFAEPGYIEGQKVMLAKPADIYELKLVTVSVH